MSFLSEPILRVEPESGEWRLERRLVFVPRVGKTIVVPAKFLTDLASIPRILQNLIPVNGKHRAAAILHDYLYVTQKLLRAQADALFLEAMKSSGVGAVQRWVMYAAVRAAGWMIWASHFAEREADLPGFLAKHGLRGRQ